MSAAAAPVTPPTPPAVATETAADPAGYLAGDLEAWQARWDEPGEAAPPTWRSLADLLADDGAALRVAHAALVEGGEPPAAAAKYLVGWIGGLLAGAVAHGYAVAGAGFLPGPDVRFRQHPGGWPDRVDLGSARLLVPAGHPWAELPGVETGTDDAVVADVVVGGLQRVLAPLISIVRTLAKVGPTALWAEVADGLATAVANQPDVPVTVAAIPRVERLVQAPEAPWRKHPRLWTAPCALGATVIAQKGGCCLAYTRPETEVDLSTYPEAHQRYHARFPVTSPRYCGNCSFRDASDVEAREIFWTEERLSS